MGEREKRRYTKIDELTKIKLEEQYKKTPSPLRYEIEKIATEHHLDYKYVRNWFKYTAQKERKLRESEAERRAAAAARAPGPGSQALGPGPGSVAPGHPGCTSVLNPHVRDVLNTGGGAALPAPAHPAPARVSPAASPAKVKVTGGRLSFTPPQPLFIDMTGDDDELPDIPDALPVVKRVEYKPVIDSPARARAPPSDVTDVSSSPEPRPESPMEVTLYGAQAPGSPSAPRPQGHVTPPAVPPLTSSPAAQPGHAALPMTSTPLQTAAIPMTSPGVPVTSSRSLTVPVSPRSEASSPAASPPPDVTSPTGTVRTTTSPASTPTSAGSVTSSPVGAPPSPASVTSPSSTATSSAAEYATSSPEPVDVTSSPEPVDVTSSFESVTSPVAQSAMSPAAGVTSPAVSLDEVLAAAGGAEAALEVVMSRRDTRRRCPCGLFFFNERMFGAHRLLHGARDFQCGRCGQDHQNWRFFHCHVLRCHQSS